VSSSPGQPRLRPAPPLSVTQSRAGPRWWRGGLVAARNGVAVVGTLFLAWSATNLSVLYFANFLAGLGAIATTYRLRFPGVTDADGLWDHAYGFLSALRAALVAMATIGIPFGLPLLFIFARAGFLANQDKGPEDVPSRRRERAPFSRGWPGAAAGGR